MEKRYQWVVGILLVVLSGISGFAIGANRLSQEVTTNTTEIKNLKEQFTRIDGKLDLLLYGGTSAQKKGTQ
jgi:peptidoglycan hydrolase CwlO-like protein